MEGMEHDLAPEAALLRVIAVEQVDAVRRVAARNGVVVDVLTAERLAGAEEPAQDDQPCEDKDPVTPGGEAAEPLEQVVQGPVPPRVTFSRRSGSQTRRGPGGVQPRQRAPPRARGA